MMTQLDDYVRPIWPKRAVVTAGMPYGNKGLHFGHIGGVFVPADTYARFLRDRIGERNVLFVCGTDCYGSPIAEGYRKLVEAGAFQGSIEDYVQENHKAQVTTLTSYGISLDIFEGSGLGKAKEQHADFTAWIIRTLYKNGHLHRTATAQFYDNEAQSFLNGRQVVGRCPVPGCKSEFAYADECDLGHQYMPADLIDPISSLSGKPPVMRGVENWYFDLPGFRELLKQHVANLNASGETRAVVSNTIDEFLVAPSIYVKQEHEDSYHELADALPAHDFKPVERGKQSFELVFDSLAARDAARLVLDGAELRYRTGKTLVPFRITGNIPWGVRAPELESSTGLTVWCWPESLWAPISFTRTYLENAGVGIESLNVGKLQDEGATWEDYWCDPEAKVYQFIGQDNIYFYGVAQTALWSALPAGHEPRAVAAAGELQQSLLVANYHLQFLGKKASSSGTVKPPMADELLEYYTAEQLRAHFLALGLGLKPVSFQPKPLNPDAKEGDADPALKEGQLLTNVLNRLARSCFYAAQKDTDGRLPLGVVDEQLLAKARAAILEYERLMHRQEFHAVMQLMSDFIRMANKYWSDAIKGAGEDAEAKRSVLLNAFYLLKVAIVLMHPVAPQGTELVFAHLDLPIEKRAFFSWEHIFEGYEGFVSSEDVKSGGHGIKELPPRFDFFQRHESQF
ncbi:MAG: class I tRNA ligase family protein [Coriobacteriales bacterium]|jgi:methionyl-tRNA synthetase|nr:class I tRNA ligase family protein [Coriobacteriales bacterium]